MLSGAMSSTLESGSLTGVPAMIWLLGGFLVPFMFYLGKHKRAERKEFRAGLVKSALCGIATFLVVFLYMFFFVAPDIVFREQNERIDSTAKQYAFYFPELTELVYSLPGVREQDKGDPGSWRIEEASTRSFWPDLMALSREKARQDLGVFGFLDNNNLIYPFLLGVPLLVALRWLTRRRLTLLFFALFLCLPWTIFSGTTLYNGAFYGEYLITKQRQEIENHLALLARNGMKIEGKYRTYRTKHPL